MKKDIQERLLKAEKDIARICQSLEEELGLCVKSLDCNYLVSMPGPHLMEVKIDSLELTLQSGEPKSDPCF